MCMYTVEFGDGNSKIYSANTIVSNIHFQVYEEGYSQTMLNSILDIRYSSNGVKDDNVFVLDRKGRSRMRKTTAGDELQVALKYSEKIYKQWIPLKDLKESNPVKVAEFSKARGLDYKPAICWWAGYTLWSVI